MADNSDKDKQNDTQLESDNNDKPIADKDKQLMDSSEDHNEVDDDSQDVKSSDMAKPVSSPENESEKRCTSASNAGESEYESADDEEVKRNDSFDDAIDGQNEQNEDIEKKIEVTDKNEEEKESKAQDIEELGENSIENTDSTEKIVENVPKEDGISDDNSTQVESITQKMSQNTEQSNEESKTESVSDFKNEENKLEMTELKKESEPEDQANEENKELEKSDEEEIINDQDDNLAEEEDDHDLADDEEYEDIESDDCTDESLDHDDNKENEEIDAEERQQGDGEESNDSQVNQNDKSLDHDEDKRNPQYIPKRGPFYEHDDRAAAEAEGEVVEEVVEDEEEAPPKAVDIAKKQPIEAEAAKKKPKRKVWTDGDRWGHDLFREDEQAPKSRDELVNIYGYDIRNEDNPPKARRRKHYGKGPNVYTRKWEDESAYGKARSPPPNDKREKRERKERGAALNRGMRSASKNDSNDRLSKERSGSESMHRDDRKDYERRDSYERRDFERRDSHERKERPERRDKDKKDKYRGHDKIDKIGDRPLRSEKSIEQSHKRERFRSDRPHHENRNPKYDFEDSIDRREDRRDDRREDRRPFSKDDFPELQTNDLRKKLIASQEGRKSGQRFNDNDVMNEYKTEPMKIIEAIEHNNRVGPHGEQNAANIVRTITFENSKYAQRRSSSNHEFEDERIASSGRPRIKKNIDSDMSVRAIKKGNNNNYQNCGHERKDAKDNYRNNRNTMKNERSDRGYQSEESNRNVERYYEEDYRNQRDRDSNYVDPNIGLQKIAIEDKSQMINRSNESEQTRPKRYSSLRQQQQRVIPESMSNIATNTQMPATSDNHNITAHQYYESHTIQSTPYFAETTSPRPAYHPYMSPTGTDAGPQNHPSTYIQPQIPQPLTQRYIPQPSAPPAANDTSRFIPTAVTPNVVTAPLPTPQMAQTMPQSMPQPGPVPPPPQPVISAPAPGPAYIPSFPSGYPQFPPAPPPTHVPPGYPPHVPTQQASPHQMAELYRGGVTYYDTQSQQQNAARQVPQRRPKAAIPIVPPPDSHSSEGDGDKSYVSVNS